jgi:FkbM family methyltransferase
MIGASRLQKRIHEFNLMARFAWTRGSSWRERARLFYYAGLKDSLAYRGWAKCFPERILQFRFRVGPDRVFQVHARDNGMDVGTIAEFFSSRYVIIPPELPAMTPKVIYDLGANIGIASLYFSMHYPEARFYGFEPLPINQEVCALNYRNLRGSQAFPWAIGARNETATFELSTSDPRGGRLKGSPPPMQGQLNERITVQVFSIPELVSTQKLEPPNFVKIDVEGAELEVLKGIGRHCPSIQRMLVETHGLELEAACMEWMKANGFKVGHTHSAAPGFASIWCDRV